MYCPACKVPQVEGFLPVGVAQKVAALNLDMSKVRATADIFAFKSLMLGKNPMQHTPERTALVLIMCTTALKTSNERAYVRAVLQFCANQNLGDPWTRYKSEMHAAAGHFRVVHESYLGTKQALLEETRQDNIKRLQSMVKGSMVTGL